MKSLFDHVFAACKEYSLVPEGGHVLAAVSGGPDSTALLLILSRLCPLLHARMTAAHFHHGIRGADADEDARFVGRLAAELNVPFVLERGDAPAHKKRRGISLQEAARELRLEFLERTRREVGADRTALAHTRDDQVEELLLRLLRGAGPDGLAGMPVRSEPALIRPLLFVSKRELLAFLEENGRSFRVDPSNKEDKYLRNRVREHIIPLFREENPRFDEAAERLTVMAARDREYFRTRTLELWPQAVRYENRQMVILDCAFVAGLHPSLASRLVRRALEVVAGTVFTFSAHHVEEVLGALGNVRESVHFDLPSGVAIEIGQGEMAVLRRDAFGQQQPKPFSGPGTIVLEEIGARVDMLASPLPDDPRTGPWYGFVDADKLSWPVVVRTFHPGDRMTPLGMQGTKKLKELFIDRKVPRWKRRTMPLIESRGEVMWVFGLGPSEKVRIEAESRNVLQIRCRGWMIPGRAGE